jgi:hypothetical protein
MMSRLLTSLIAFVCILAGALFGMFQATDIVAYSETFARQ